MREGLRGSPLHHPQTHSSENKQSLKLHQREGSKGSLPPGTPWRGRGARTNARHDGRWRRDGAKQKLHLASRGENGVFCEKAPEVKQMSDSTGPETMIKHQHKHRLELQVWECCHGSKRADFYLVTAVVPGTRQMAACKYAHVPLWCTPPALHAESARWKVAAASRCSSWWWTVQSCCPGKIIKTVLTRYRSR